MSAAPFITRKSFLWSAAATLALLALALALALALLVERLEIAPRSLGPYLERRAEGHNPLIAGFGSWAGRTLVALDRGDQLPFALPALTLGAQPVPAATVNAAIPQAVQARQVVFVDSAAAARTAIQAARPGNVITFLPGSYHFSDRTIVASQPGSSAMPITVRAQQPGTVTLLFGLSEGFKVSAPYWVFENLTIQGVCRQHGDCEHAFHVVSQASHFIARNNVITDFNAHFKINGEGNIYPDHGVIEANTLSNASVRQTANPVTPIDLVGASDWRIRGNLISDFIKGEGNRVSYGAFAKGAGSGNRFERNIILCERALRGAPGQRVGLSLGGGGTGSDYCRDRRCLTEHDGGSIDGNLIASCSDDGIYLNRASASKVAHNTLLDTAGITVRFAVSSADIEGNLVDGLIRSRDDGVVRAVDNLTGAMAASYLGWHTARALYRQPATLDLAWRTAPPRRDAGKTQASDLCGRNRPAQPVYGAFEDFADCLGFPGAARTIAPLAVGMR
ncbi:right-handed parallel beta-helix repeat-containing protein [Noviherbaspirillum sedimenti]|uniref:Right-handed parallel beta-helix repeat-containing protein n=1 Tax=Noviherbaspirillum sedimenti TaxID=2320865 RepID=A0A3A3FZC9_9BURK|nr:right-handed parallel beta-helix repeat-containing protein [Noviherbaspirillum sedimenti]RJG01568.1 right-handed parallel beta-helix repeat-containing protein [Noviherbaspirillum sedimenti]